MLLLQSSSTPPSLPPCVFPLPLSVTVYWCATTVVLKPSHLQAALHPLSCQGAGRIGSFISLNFHRKTGWPTPTHNRVGGEWRRWSCFAAGSQHRQDGENHIPLTTISEVLVIFYKHVVPLHESGWNILFIQGLMEGRIPWGFSAPNCSCPQVNFWTNHLELPTMSNKIIHASTHVGSMRRNGPTWRNQSCSGLTCGVSPICLECAASVFPGVYNKNPFAGF